MSVSDHQTLKRLHCRVPEGVELRGVVCRIFLSFGDQGASRVWIRVLGLNKI